MTTTTQNGLSFTPSPAITRLGQISFINSLPIVIPFERNYIPVSATTYSGDPASLNRRVLRGELDVSAMSSFFYLQKQKELSLVPNISISCLGPVGSVLFFSKEEPAKLHGKIIQTSSSSATSVNLLSVLLAEQFGVRPKFIASPEPDLDKPEVAGALLIGDQALSQGESWSGRYLRIDLGQWWMQQFHFPMVFGVWAARNDWRQERPFEFDRIADALVRAKNLGLGPRFNEIIDEAAKRSGLARGELTIYYKRQLNFDFTERHAAGLDLYRKLCEKHGLLKAES